MHSRWNSFRARRIYIWIPHVSFHQLYTYRIRESCSWVTSKQDQSGDWGKQRARREMNAWLYEDIAANVQDSSIFKTPVTRVSICNIAHALCVCNIISIANTECRSLVYTILAWFPIYFLIVNTHVVYSIFIFWNCSILASQFFASNSAVLSFSLSCSLTASLTFCSHSSSIIFFWRVIVSFALVRRS